MLINQSGVIFDVNWDCIEVLDNIFYIGYDKFVVVYNMGANIFMNTTFL